MRRFNRSATLCIIASFFSIVSWARENKAIDVSPAKGESLWYYFPWIWVTGGAIFILLLVAMIRTHQK